MSVDLTPTELQSELRDSFGAFFAKEATSTVVRDAEPLGFDAEFWSKLCELGALEMVLPGAAESVSGLWEHALLASLVGEYVAPVPFLEVAPVSRFLALHHDGTFRDVADGSRIVSLIPQPIDAAGRQVVPNGAVADRFLARRADTVVLVGRPAGADPVANLASSPIAVFDLAAATDAEVVLRGAEALAAWETLLAEWRLGLAAALAAIAQRTLELATEQARTREQFGAPIGSFQAVSHRLADVATHVDATRLIVDKATWAIDLGLPTSSRLIDMAWAEAAYAAEHAATTAVHVFGGYGITEEYDVQLYFRRAKGWTLIGGGRRAALARVANQVLA